MTNAPENILAFANSTGWRAWLEEHHAVEPEAWVLFYKGKAASQGPTYEQAVEEALCFGWIDGLLRRIDEATYALRFTPRKARSIWSESNKQRVKKLIGEGRMTAAGLEAIAAARANGEWDAAAAREDTGAIPADLASELHNRQAWEAFSAWTPSRKKQALYWLNSARRAETRQKRILEIAELALAGKNAGSPQ